MTEENHDNHDDHIDRAQAHLASLKRDMRKTLEDAAVRATHKVMADLEHDEHAPDCSPDEFLLRGILASELKCWHRLTGEEAQNLLDFVRNMPEKPAQQQQECKHCGGTGDTSGEYPGVACPECNGAGIQAQPEFITHSVDQPYDWSEWVCPDPKSYLMKCCDCGLVHEAQFRVAKYQPSPSDECDVVDDPDLQAQFRMRRSEQWSTVDTAHRAGGLPMEQPARDEPYGQVTVVRRPGCVEQHWFYRWPEPPYLDNAAECHMVYTRPQAREPEQPAQHLSGPCGCGKQNMAWCAANTCSKAEQPAQQQTWHHPDCEGECIACLIERKVEAAYGTQGLAYLHRHIAVTKPLKPWVNLTDEEMHACWDSPLTPLGMKHVRMIEAKLKDKNA